jgi:hypothetical protein
LLRHDWVYRWARILEIAGLHLSAGMAARQQTLKELAEHARVQ